MSCIVPKLKNFYMILNLSALFYIIIFLINKTPIYGSEINSESAQWILYEGLDDCKPPISKIVSIIGHPAQCRQGISFDGNQVQGLLYGTGVNGELHINKDFTIWVRAAFGPPINRPLANHDTLVSRWGTLGNYSFLLRSDHHTKTLHLFLSPNGKEILSYNSFYPVDRSGRFHDIVVVVRMRQSVAFYIDGQERCNLCYPQVPNLIYDPPDNILPFAIGYNSDPAPGGDYETMNGIITGVRVFHSALTPAEIAGLSGVTLEQDKQTSCKIEIDVNKPVGRVNPFLFGHFIEHFQNVVYGGLYEAGSPNSDINGFRVDVINALKLLQPTLIRWPGGNYTSAYHWQWGAGLKKHRPTIYSEPVWGQTEPHTFGTPEFIEVCKRLGAEPLICVGVGRDPRCPTAEEAAAWVRYCNATEGSEASLRKEAGYPDPFNVMLWGLGNEVYGSWQIGFYQNPKNYVEDIVKYAKAMRAADSRIKFIICGDSYKPYFNIWNEQILTNEILHLADWISYHSYTHLGSFGQRLPHEAAMSSLLQIESDITELANLNHDVSRRAGRKDPIKIAVDEWNELSWGDIIDNARQEHYNLSHTIFTASFLNVLLRHSDDVTMANYSPGVNCRGLIYVSKQGILLRPTYYVYQMYKDCADGTSVSVNTDVPILNGSAAPVLDVAGVRLKDGALILFVVNREKEKSLLCQVKLNGFVVQQSEGKILTGDSLSVYNDFSHPNTIIPQNFEVNVKGNEFALNFPPRSIVTLLLKP